MTNVNAKHQHTQSRQKNFPLIPNSCISCLKSENKVWLQKLLMHRFKAIGHFQQAELIYCEGDVAENLTRRREENGFVFQQVEADTIILSTYAKLRVSHNGTVIRESEDTDVYVQAAYVAEIYRVIFW